MTEFKVMRDQIDSIISKLNAKVKKQLFDRGQFELLTLSKINI